MLDKIYCLTCKRLFDDRMETRRRQGVISFGQFMYNQQRILWDESIKFTGNKRIFEVSCPFCWSKNTVDATEIMEEIIKTKKSQKRNKMGRFTKENKYQALKIYPKWLRDAIEKAYRKRVPLNTMNNIIRYGDS